MWQSSAPTLPHTAPRPLREVEAAHERLPSAVKYAVRTGRLITNNEPIWRHVSMATVAVETYVSCAASVHALETATIQQHRASTATPINPAVIQFINWGNAYRDETVKRSLKEIVQPKIADLLMFYTSAKDYSEEQIEVFVESLNEIMTVPQPSAAAHDALHSRAFVELACPTVGGERRSPAITVEAAVLGGRVPPPCVSIQRCHSLFPIQLSSPLGRTPQQAITYGDSHLFGRNISRAVFSSLLPLLVSLTRYDVLMVEMCCGRGSACSANVVPPNCDSGSSNLQTSSEDKWLRLNKAAHSLERVWRQNALFVDFVDPEVRALAALKQKHSGVVVRTGGTVAVKRRRSRDPLKCLVTSPNDVTHEKISESVKDYSWLDIISRSSNAPKYVGSLQRLPRDIIRLVSHFVTPRGLLPLILTSKVVARCILLTTDNFGAKIEREGLTFSNTYVLKGLQMSRNMGLLLSQFVEQLWGERYIYLRDPEIVRSDGRRKQSFAPFLKYFAVVKALEIAKGA